MEWSDVFKRDDLIGGDIETVENGIPYRGPLSKIENEGEMIRFTSPWTAWLNPQTGEWETWHKNDCSVNMEVEPQDIGQGRVSFEMLFLGHCTIYPKGGSKLDPKKVKGLPQEFLS